jgi:hypothetical protein
MAYAFDDEEVELPPVTMEEVVAELQDWRLHLSALFDTLVSWLPPDAGLVPIRGERGILESPMRKVGLTAQMFPTFSVESTALNKGMAFLPEARWVFLTRGRIFLMHPAGMTYVEDHGQPGQPNWLLYPHRNRSSAVPFTSQEFQILLDGLR